jgi:O-antigen/teichoic acid export membrane protein
MLQPRLAGARDRAAAWRMAARALLLLLSLAGGAMVLAWLFGAEVIGAINADYVPHAGLLPLLAIYPLLAGIATVLQSMLRARERYAPVLLAHALSACTALAVGVPLAAAHGMLGAVIGIVSGYSVAVVVQGVRLR